MVNSSNLLLRWYDTGWMLIWHSSLVVKIKVQKNSIRHMKTDEKNKVLYIIMTWFLIMHWFKWSFCSVTCVQLSLNSFVLDETWGDIIHSWFLPPWWECFALAIGHLLHFFTKLSANDFYACRGRSVRLTRFRPAMLYDMHHTWLKKNVKEKQLKLFYCLLHIMQ